MYVHTYTSTVELPNKGHIRAASFVLCNETVPIKRLKLYWNYRGKYFGTSKYVLCREAVLISKYPLSEIPLYYLISAFCG